MDLKELFGKNRVKDLIKLIRDRIAPTEEAIESLDVLSPEEVEKIWKEIPKNDSSDTDGEAPSVRDGLVENNIVVSSSTSMLWFTVKKISASNNPPYRISISQSYYERNASGNRLVRDVRESGVLVVSSSNSLSRIYLEECYSYSEELDEIDDRYKFDNMLRFRDAGDFVEIWLVNNTTYATYLKAVVLGNFGDTVTFVGEDEAAPSDLVSINKGASSATKLIASVEQSLTNIKSMSFSAICPTNKFIEDDVGEAGVYVQIGAQKLSALINGGDDKVHPAFIINDEEQNSIYIGKYQGFVVNDRVYSLAGVEPRTKIDQADYGVYCKNKGAGHHCVTAAEWGFLASCCKKNKCQPKGNNDYGKDVFEDGYVAIPATKGKDGKTNLVITGTGPVTWNHNGQIDGIWGLNGNIWQWVTGIRLYYGELLVIPYNDAASAEYDPNDDSTAKWKAVNAAATSWGELFISRTGLGTTSGSVKLDFVSGHWHWDTTINSSSNTTRSALFASTTASSTIGKIAKMYLIAMALMPEDDTELTDYNGSEFSANNAVVDCYATRGGSWSEEDRGGVFSLSFVNKRSTSNVSIGGRPSFADLSSVARLSVTDVDDEVSVIGLEEIQNAE